MDTFKELGIEGALEKLYAGSGFQICTNPWFENSDGYIVTASRLLLEGIDFDLSYFPFNHLGYKSVLCVTGELYSNLAAPKTLKVIIGVSAKLDFTEVAQIWDGIVAAAKEFGYQSVALDLEPSLTGLSISVGATGCDTFSREIHRPIAKSMDLICVSNNLGAAFIGEQILSRAKELPQQQRSKKLEGNRQLIGAYLKPELPAGILESFADSGICPSFGYFCRESFGAVVKRLCKDSGLGAKIYVDRIPFAGGSIDAAKELGVDPMQAVLKGGDDNCLLFTIPIGSHERFRHDFQNWDIIGHLAKSGVGAVLVSPDGLEHNM